MKVSGLDALQKEAARFALVLKPKSDEATVVALSGDLGAGKTSFAQGMARALGINESVTSPTFVIEKSYDLEGQAFRRLIHIDAYRLESPHELEVLGWNGLIRDSGNLILVEWPEIVAAIVPKTSIRVTLQGSGDSRIITYG